MTEMFAPTFPIHARQRGFSLVEIMVGLVIGLLAVLVIMQVFSLAESNRRNTSGSGDASSEGAIALYTLQRDLRQAGYGMASLDLFACNVTPPAAGSPNIPFAPVTISPLTTAATAAVPPGDSNTDTLLVFYGNPAGQTEGQTGSVMLDTNTYYVMTGSCATTAAAISKTGSTAPVAAITASGTLYDLGPGATIRAYAVRGGNLTVCNYLTSNCNADCVAGNPTCNANWTTVASNIVSLRVQYGRENATPAGPPDNFVVDTYDQTAPNDSCTRAKIAVVRLSIVSRSPQPSGNATSSKYVRWYGDENGDGSGTLPIDLSGFTNWKNYRYKVFQTTVPLRNITWMGRPC